MNNLKYNTGRRNLITDIDGILVGNSHDTILQSGVTVLKLSKKFRASAEIHGGAPATREMQLLNPQNTVQYIDSIILTGGSVFGLGSAASIVDILKKEQRGYKIRKSNIHVPIVPTAAIYDINEESANTITSNTYSNLAEKAYNESGKNFELGNFGAGYGAKSGLLKGGQGSASIVSPEGAIIGAISIVNSVGSALIPNTKLLYSSLYEMDNELGGLLQKNSDILKEYKYNPELINDLKLFDQENGRKNTTISVIATNVSLTKSQLNYIAKMSFSGLSRAIRPSGTTLDGDLTIVISNCELETKINDQKLTRLGSLSSDTLTRSIGRAIYNAKSLNNVISYSDMIK